MSCSNWSGVRPVACTSPTSGREIFPSDRTGTAREISGSFQTFTASTSSAPIIKLSSCGLPSERTTVALASLSVAASTTGESDCTLFDFFVPCSVCDHKELERQMQSAHSNTCAPTRFLDVFVMSYSSAISNFLRVLAATQSTALSVALHSVACWQTVRGRLQEGSSDTAESCTAGLCS